MRANSRKRSSTKGMKLVIVLAILILSATILATSFNLMYTNLNIVNTGSQTGHSTQENPSSSYADSLFNQVLSMKSYTEPSNKTLFLIIGKTGTRYMRNFVGKNTIMGNGSQVIRLLQNTKGKSCIL